MKQKFYFIPMLAIVLHVSLVFSQSDTSIVFSEIMFNPVTSFSNNEFIELFNTSYTDSFNLSSWKIRYAASTPDNITDAGYGTKLAPRKYAIIFEQDYLGGYTVPSSSLILKIHDHSFGTSGMANTEARELKLINSKGDTTSSYTYSVPNPTGYSDEKVILIANNSASNWANSLVINGSPGGSNSVSPKEYDLGVTSIFFSPSAPVLNDTISISAMIKNLGLNPAQNFSVKFSYDTNGDSIPDIDLPSVPISNLNARDSLLVIATQKINRILNRVVAFCSIEFTQDENLSNNNFSISIEPGLSPKSILINEFMFDPLTGEPEWVELFNNTDGTINLKSWKISDVLSTPTLATITNSDFNFLPKSFLILATDTTAIKNFYASIPSKIIRVSIPALNNDKDGVVLYDHRGAVMDSVFYLSSWGIKGNSLERISLTESSTKQSNWVASFADSGGTPGQENSAKDAKSYSRNSFVINEIMFDQLSGLSEYVEFYNTTSDTINIAGWRYTENGGLTLTLSGKIKKIPPGGYVILSADSSNLKHFSYLAEGSPNYYVVIANRSDLSLSNTEDMVKIIDLFGNTIDSVFYNAKWHNSEIEDTKGRSLERINPLLSSTDAKNWSTSVNILGGSPGKQNSIFTRTLPSQSSLEISPNPFSPDNDGFEDFTIFTYKLSQSTASIRIRIYDSQGRLVRTLADNQPSSAGGSIIFNGLDDHKQPLRIGIYAVLLEAINQTNGVVDKVKKTLVVARKLK
ncbi:MAG: hypothetical protein FJ213_06345 [Ignavibacteria bacterium]|nr:hypothetical protein [Ignavibacteria bacterium]